MNEPQSQSPSPIDKDKLKKAYKAFKKRLKLTRLDEESNLNFRPTSSGKHSSVVAIEPPLEFSREVWEELVRQGKLKRSGHGMYEMVPEEE